MILVVLCDFLPLFQDYYCQWFYWQPLNVSNIQAKSWLSQNALETQRQKASWDGKEKVQREGQKLKSQHGDKRPPFHVYCHWASRGLGGFCGAGGCWVVSTVQDPGDQYTSVWPPLPHSSSPIEGPILLFCHFCCWLLHCSYVTSWSNYMQIKNIFFFKTMLKKSNSLYWRF